MATLTIQDLPEDVCAFLRNHAKRNRRSLSQEVVHILAEGCAAARQQRLFEEAMAGVDEIRKGMTTFPTSEDIERAIEEGRR